MSRKLNLRMPTPSDLTFHRSASELSNPESPLPAKPLLSLKSIRENLNKTSMVLENLCRSSTDSSSKTEDSQLETSKEVSLLKAKISRLEQERQEMLVLRSKTSVSNYQQSGYLVNSITRLTESVAGKIKENLQWKRVWDRKIKSEQELVEKVKAQEFAVVLYQMLDFLNEVADEGGVRRARDSLESAAIRRERISSLSRQLSEFGTKTAMSSLGNRDSVEL